MKDVIIRCVVVESPYGSDDPAVVRRNESYADACMLDCFERGEAPFLSHLLYTRLLNDRVPEDRERGIAAGLAWIEGADALVVYVDLGITDGMKRGMERAIIVDIPIEHRALGSQWAQKPDEEPQR